MATATRMDVVDIDIDPLAERVRRRNTVLRIGLPLGGVGLIIGFLLGIALYTDRANRAGVLGLSDTLLHGLQEQVALQVSAYLAPASHAALLANSMLGRGGATIHAAEAFAFARSVLSQTPQVANVLFADGAGNFMLVRHAIGGAEGFTETKRILMQPAGRTVEWITRDPAGLATSTRLDPADSYDARNSAWFKGARLREDVFWTGVYIFFSEHLPGVTNAVHGPDADPDVVGIDIKLDALSKFLGSLTIGRTGRAYLVSSKGEMIAGPDSKLILRDQDGKLTPAKVDEVGDAGLAGSWDHWRLQGAGTRVIEVAGQRLISIVTPVSEDQQGWLLVITVPEAEFSGFVTVNAGRAGLLSLIVVALALGLAVLLVRQGLRADRADRAVAERSDAVRQQGAAFARLAVEAGQFAPDGTPPRALVETLAEATGARRAGMWRLLGQGQTLRCDDSFEPANAGHVGGVELSRQEIPALIDALMRGEEVDAPDARRDRRTAALHGLLMAPLGSTSLFAVPVRRAGTGAALGMVLLEDARRGSAARDIARACAALAALCTPADAPAGAVAARAGAAVAGTAPVAAGPVEAAGDAQGLDTALAALALHDAAVPIQGRACVLVLRLPEDALARSAGAGESLAHRIACVAQDAASAHGVGYVKMLGTTIVAATGFSAPTNTATPTNATPFPNTALGAAADAARLAELAVTLRETCAALFEDVDDPAPFTLGLDSGTVLGGALGTAPKLFTLWGEAVRGAGTLADSAPSGTIQASEQTYRLLRQGFLFRPRGLFHRSGVGPQQSYILAGPA